MVGVGSKRVTDLTPARMTFLATSIPSPPRPEGREGERMGVREGIVVWMLVVYVNDWLSSWTLYS